VKFALLIYFDLVGLDSLLVNFCKLLGLVNLVAEFFFEALFVAQVIFVVDMPNHARSLIFFIHQ